MKRRVIFLFVFVSIVSGMRAQDDTVSVPDVRGLSVPEAVATLNRAGLNFGEEIIDEWNTGSSATPNTVNRQSPEAGASLSRGAAVDLTVLREFNAEIVYDDNDLTLINLGERDINYQRLTFGASDSSRSFAGVNWRTPTRTLRPEQCVQIWSVTRNGPKTEVCPDQRGVAHWLADLEPGEQFWTGTDDSEQFLVVQDGILRGACAISGVINQIETCELYLAPGVHPDEMTDYVFFVYDREQLIILNRATDRWMPVESITIGRGVEPGNVTTYDQTPDVGNVALLASGQCTLFTSASSTTDMAACDIIATATLGAGGVFWADGFTVSGVAEDSPSCPAPGDGRAICLVPRR